MRSGALAPVLQVVALVAAGLLVPAGLAKLRRPEAVRRALGGGLLARDAVVRAIGAGELLLAAWILLDGSRASVAALGLTYAAFAVVAVRQQRRGAGCGCFGATTTPTGWAHVVLDLSAVIAAGGLVVLDAATGAAPLILAAGPVAGPALVVAGATAVVAAQLVLTALPDLAVARRRTGFGGA
jgi:hypothetical protein